MLNYKEKFENLLIDVQKPARYIGGEYNTPNMEKPHNFKACLCFPDVYEVAMSNLGISILYHMLNEKEDMICERCYAPWIDLGEKLVENDIPLLSIETKTPLKEFDLVGFSMQFELLYSNLIYMLDLAKIPRYAVDRDDSYPIIAGGGPCSINPEPFADFFDCIMIGEGEDSLSELSDVIKKGKEQNLTKQQILENAKKITGVYVPSLHKKGEKVQKAVVQDINKSYYPTKPLVPNIEIVHDRAVQELYRGCSSGCRFCQASFFYRPIREKSVETAYLQAVSMLENTGFDEISLSSLSSGDYNGILDIIHKIQDYTKDKNINLTLPSLRLNSYDENITENGKKNSITFAPEAGTQRLRDVINKNISEFDIENTMRHAFMQGFSNVKLYFMIGLPTETDEDLDGIVDICKKIKDLYWEVNHSNRLKITLSTAVFIPKPFTPFQFVAQIPYDEMCRKQYYIKEKLKEQKLRGVHFNYHDAKSSIIEGVFARGDKKLSKAISIAYDLGCKFCSWTEYFNYDLWIKAFEKADININDYLREFSTTEELCWDFIDGGVTKDYLVKEYLTAINTGKNTKNCREGCNNCGALKIGRCTII